MVNFTPLLVALSIGFGVLIVSLLVAAGVEFYQITRQNSEERTSAFANLRTFYFNLLLRTIGIVVVVFFLNGFLSLLSSQGFFSSPSFLSLLSQWPSFMGFLTTVLLWAIGAGLMAYILYLMVRIIKED